MSGRVVRGAEPAHACAPGWTNRPLPAEEREAYAPATHYSVPPDPWRFPRGTVWQCECGRTWVSLGATARNAPGQCHWRPEGRIERWQRERSQMHTKARPAGV